MNKKLSLEEGIDEIIRLFQDDPERPFLVAVYGWPNAGKSYLIDSIRSKGESVGGGGGAPDPSIFERIRDGNRSIPDLLLFHCAWDRRERIFDHEDPNILTEQIANRGLNLNVGIYDPKQREALKGDYDILISNPDSKIKPPLF